ncbi:hypothetical protein KR018_006661 [Drosophila ironensis]|nr:hypothetical protein KR018_006661 [Drosophila ironensis]
MYCDTCGQVYDDDAAFRREHTQLAGACRGSPEEVDLVEENGGEDSLIEEIVEPDVPLWEVVEQPQAEAEPEAESESKAEPERYFCYDCHSIFENRSSAEEHVCPQAEPEGSASAPQAEEPAPTLARRKPNGPGPRAAPGVSCEICNTVFSSAKFLKFHMRIHEKRSNKTIQDALPVGAHQQYSELDQFYCEICNKSFDENLLTVHKQMHQRIDNEIMCGICNRQFENSVNYQMHLKIHEKPQKTAQAGRPSKEKAGFPCQFCEKVFTRPYEKVKHERVHTGEKPYSCEVCGKAFRVSYSLTLHLRTHTDIRPYVCTVCNKRFKSHPVYSHHLRTHSSERQFQCDICAKTFRTSVQLYGHKNSHTKPFLCVVCNRPFASLYAVKSHMQTHDENGSSKAGAGAGAGPSAKSQSSGKFWCSTCGAEYARLFPLRLHMKAAHGLTDSPPREEASPGKDMEAEDSETAVLIAAAEADAAYISAVVNDVDVSSSVPSFQEGVEFDVDNFHSEEIITDWLK